MILVYSVLQANIREHLFLLVTHDTFEIKRVFCFIGNFGCSQEILSIAAMMQIQNVFVVPSNQKSQAVSLTFSPSCSYKSCSLWSFLC